MMDPVEDIRGASSGNRVRSSSAKLLNFETCSSKERFRAVTRAEGNSKDEEVPSKVAFSQCISTSRKCRGVTNVITDQSDRILRSPSQRTAANAIFDAVAIG